MASKFIILVLLAVVAATLADDEADRGYSIKVGAVSVSIGKKPEGGYGLNVEVKPKNRPAVNVTVGIGGKKLGFDVDVNVEPGEKPGVNVGVGVELGKIPSVNVTKLPSVDVDVESESYETPSNHIDGDDNNHA